MASFNHRHTSILVWALVAMAGGAAGWWGVGRQRARTTRDLLDDTRRCALAFDGGELRGLTGTPADLSRPGYLAVKTRLVRLRQISPSIRLVRILRRQPSTGRIVLLADSEPPDSSQLASPGDVFANAGAPGLQALIRGGRATIDGPSRDAGGVGLRGYAWIAGRRPSPGDAAEDILVLDLAAGHWRRDLLAAGLRDALGAWLLLGIPLGGLLVGRRLRRQGDLVRKLGQAVEQSRTAVVITRADQSIEYVNAGLCAITGWRRDELLGRPVRQLAAGEDADARAREVLETVGAGRTWRGNLVNLRRDGSTYPARCVASPVHDRSGRLTHVIMVIEDVTEQRQVEATLTYAKERAEAGERAKGQFLTMMSHEIRTPLNGIIGFTDLLLDTPLTSDQIECVRTIRSSGEALLQLTGDVLDFSRIDAGRLSLEPQPCDPLECIESAFEEFAARAAEKQIELLHGAEAEVPAAILIDAARLRQVLVNLVSNAVKFTPRGKVEVTVAAALKPEDPDAAIDSVRPIRTWELIFTVRDTGIGITPEGRSRLFKPFSQVDSTSTRKFSGAGLGLVISQSLVQMMRGEISVDSEVGQGTTVTFSILAEEVPGAKTPVPSNLAGRTLALVSTSPALRQELGRLAAAWGTKTVACEPATLAAETWDLAVVDLAVDQTGTWRRLFAERPELSSRPTVALVPVDLPPPGREWLAGHFRAWMRKPVRHHALGMLLDGSLTPVAGEPAAPGPAPAAELGLRAMLVADNPVTQRITQKMLENLGCHWDLAETGRIALTRLDRGTYDLVLLELHLPEMDGFAVIEQIRRGRAGAAHQGVWITVVAGDAAEAQRVVAVTGGADDCIVQPVRQTEFEAALRRCLTRPPRDR